jgi:CheY-like chemotaxis protein
MDMHMPVLDGIGAITFIRNNENKTIKKTPIIVLTAIESEEEKEKCKKLKVNDYILKPYSNNELFSAVYNVLKVV